MKVEGLSKGKLEIITENIHTLDRTHDKVILIFPTRWPTEPIFQLKFS